MKIRIHLKDPDGFSQSVDDAVEQAIQAEFPTADDDENEAIREMRTEKVWAALEKFVEYQEYVTIEFDTEKGTAEVVKRK